jgi:hypothetical protein
VITSRGTLVPGYQKRGQEVLANPTRNETKIIIKIIFKADSRKTRELSSDSECADVDSAVDYFVNVINLVVHTRT